MDKNRDLLKGAILIKYNNNHLYSLNNYTRFENITCFFDTNEFS